MRQLDDSAIERIKYLEAKVSALRSEISELRAIDDEREELLVALKAEITKMRQDRDYEGSLDIEGI